MAKRLRADQAAAREIVVELAARGYIERSAFFVEGEYWKNTIRGNAFAGATAAKPLLRASADKRLKEFLDRVEEVRRDPYYLYRVHRVILFGSYLTSKDRINDIDLCVSLTVKEKDKQDRLREQRVEETLRRGKVFKSFIDRLTWPETEVLKFLKAKSRSISLHTGSDAPLTAGGSKVIYRDGK
ncbi:MAG: nucleotidyltransferase domain-containing protein [Elusimicrobia bacterium]|nr:nucleotidyltransferase domain-containing protein [Elusimicrobiota bacterium]